MSGVAIYTEARGFSAMRRVLNKLSYLDSRDLLDQVGEVIEGQVRRRIKHQEGPPDGGKWAEYSERYGSWKRSLGLSDVGFLQLHGDLLDSMTHNVIGSDAVETGSDKPYAAKHQLGSKDGHTPAREFLGLSDKNQDDVEKKIVKWIREVVKI